MTPSMIYPNAVGIGLAVWLALGAVVAAAPGDDFARPPGPPNGEGPRPPGGQFGFQGAPGILPVERVLTEEQREAFRDELQAHRDQLREINEKAARLRPELDEALLAEKLDEKLVREKVAALAELDGERSLIRARALAKVRPSLSEEQLTRLKHLRAELGRGDFRPGPEHTFRGAGDGGFRGPPQDFRGPGQGDNPPGDRRNGPRPPRPPGGIERAERDPLPPPAPPPPPPPPPPPR